jgi:ABC-type branched-subunit amino acid transport system substrate-binding protein
VVDWAVLAKVSSDVIGATTETKKEVDELKRIVFLTIGALLVLGLVLPGCTTPPPPEEHVINIAVVGPMTDLQGTNMMNGATMAKNELNALNGGQGVNVAGTYYTIKLTSVETRESTEGETGSTGQANLNAVIDDVNFCTGGFRTEVVDVYREVAMDASKIFMDVGAATNSLCYSVNDDYAKYKYFFRVQPYNNVFLVTSCLKMTGTVGSVLKSTLQGLEATNAAYVKDEFKISNNAGGKLRAEILMENAAWCQGMVAAAQAYLPTKLGYNVTGLTLVSPTATDITAELTAIKARNPDIIFTAFSGSVGAVYSVQKASLGIPALTIGINVPAQQLVHWANTDGHCEGEIELDTWAVGMNQGTGTDTWFDDYVAQFGIYPVYTAATYDTIKQVVKGMQSIGSTTDSDALVTWLQTHPNTNSVGGPEVAVYPVAETDLGPVPAPYQPYYGTGEMWALTEAQVRAIYDLDSYGWSYNASQWMVTPTGTGGPHEANDLVYGPGYATGIGAQWQLVDGAGTKVGIWPKQVAPAATPTGTLIALGLIDQYGNWNFQYEGTQKIILPIGNMLNIPWDAYAHSF